MRLHSCLFLLFALLSPLVQAAILAIDYGAEFTKLSLIKPGVPFDVLLDRDARRKISSVVGWKKNDRVFGAEGKMSASRFPATHFPYVKPLIAATEVPNLPIYPNPPQLTEDGSLIFPHAKVPEHIKPAPSADAAWTPVDILAHQIAYFKGLADEASAPDHVTQVVVTVPNWFDQQQRKAYRDAIELQGLTCLGMLGEGTAVGLNYAMTRQFPTFDPATGEGEKEYYIVYDSGAIYTSATVLAMYQTSERVSPRSRTLLNTTHVEALGVGWEHIGAVDLDVATRGIIQDAFVAKTGRPEIAGDARAQAKLAKEAVRVKQILSANSEALTSVESVFDDLDFRGTISRAQLEAAMAGRMPAFLHPIEMALQDAGLSMDDMKAVLLFGGNARVPMVQAAVRGALGGRDDKIAQSVNGDEAAVLGAAFYGAALSRQFKMKSVEIDEHAVYDFALRGHGPVFPKGTVQGARTTLLLKPEDKMDLVFEQSGTPVLEVTVPGLADALANFTAPEPVVNLTLRLDKRGFFSVAQATLVSNATDVPEKAAKGVLGGLFGKKDKAEDAAAEAEAGEDAANDTKAEKAAAKPKKPAARVALQFHSKPLFKTLSKDEKRTTRERLASIATYERALLAREEARNKLEAYLYRVQNYLSDAPDSRALFDFGSDAERARLQSAVASAFAWLQEHAESAPAPELTGRLTELEALEAPIALRYTEWMARPKAVENFKTAMHVARAFIVSAAENRTEALKAAEAATEENPVAPPKYGEEELLRIANLLKEYEEWVDPLMSQQVKLDEDMKADPVIFSKDLDDKGKALQLQVQALERRKDPKAPRPKKKAAPKKEKAETEEQKEEQKVFDAEKEEAPREEETKQEQQEEAVRDEL